MATVLVAESDRQVAHELRTRLEAMGLTVVEAGDWPDTLRKAAVHRPQLLLVSEDLPQLGMLQTCQQLRGIGGMFNTPLVLVLPDGAEKLTPEAMRKARVDEGVPRSVLRRRLLEILRRYVPVSGGPAEPGEGPEFVRGLPLASDGTGASASGDLAQMPTAFVLGQLACRWSTGTLVLEKDGVEIRVYLQRGSIVDAASNVSGLDLASLLAQTRLVGEAELAAAQEQVHESGGAVTLERVLLAAGVLDEQRLRRVLLYQRQHAVLLPLTWSQGIFSFEPGPLDPERLELGFGTADVLFAGLRALRDTHRIEGSLPPASTALRRTAHAFDGFLVSKLSDTERNVLLLLDEGSSVGSVMSRPRLDRSDAVRAVCALYAAGVVELAAPDAASAGPAAAPAAAPVAAPRTASVAAPVAAFADGRRSAAPPADSGPEAAGIVEEGSVSVLPPAKLLTELYSDRRTGVLAFLREGVRKELHVADGLILRAHSDDPADAWQQVLLRRGVITPAEARAAKGAEPGDEAPPALLVQGGALAGRLDPGWLRTEDVVLGLFGWKEGQYRFEESVHARPTAAAVPGRTEALLLAGIRSLGAGAWSTTSMPKMSARLAARPEAFQLELSAPDEKLLLALDGSVTVLEAADLADRLKAGSQTTLHALVQLDLVAVLAQPAPVDRQQWLEQRRSTFMRLLQAYMPIAESENFFAILGVAPDAPPEAVRERYLHLRERFHPERARELGLPDAAELLQDLFGRVYLAYQSLNRPEVRAAHLEELEQQALARIEAVREK
jgi:CheY-like chemotaxis protein